MSEIIKPTNLEECYKALDDMSINDSKEWINKDEDSALAMAHFGLGMWLRNNWGLWEGSELKTFFENLGIKHADDMSGIILTSYHRHKNNKEINLEEQVQHYIKFWKDQGIEL